MKKITCHFRYKVLHHVDVLVFVGLQEFTQRYMHEISTTIFFLSTFYLDSNSPILLAKAEREQML